MCAPSSFRGPYRHHSFALISLSCPQIFDDIVCEFDVECLFSNGECVYVNVVDNWYVAGAENEICILLSIHGSVWGCARELVSTLSS